MEGKINSVCIHRHAVLRSSSFYLMLTGAVVAGQILCTTIDLVHTMSQTIRLHGEDILCGTRASL